MPRSNTKVDYHLSKAHSGLSQERGFERQILGEAESKVWRGVLHLKKQDRKRKRGDEASGDRNFYRTLVILFMRRKGT